MALKDLLAKPLRGFGKLIAKKDIQTRDKDDHDLLSPTSVLSPALSMKALSSVREVTVDWFHVSRILSLPMTLITQYSVQMLASQPGKAQGEHISTKSSTASIPPYSVAVTDRHPLHTMPHIHDLPPELLHEVLRELCEDAQFKRCMIPRYFELFNFAKVCKRWDDCAFEAYRERFRLVGVPESRILALWKEGLVFA